MLGPTAIGTFVAFWGFWVLLAIAWMRGDLHIRGVVIFLALWLAGFAGLAYVLPAASLFTSYVSVLDIALVLVVFKGDVGLM